MTPPTRSAGRLRIDLGHDEPTILLTNERRTSPKALITRYAQRMLIENALSDAVRFFHMDALSSAVGLKVDFDMTLLVVASGLCRLRAGRMRGYGDAQARQIFRDLVAMPATITVSEHEVKVSFHRRSHLPIILVRGGRRSRCSTPSTSRISWSAPTGSVQDAVPTTRSMRWAGPSVAVRSPTCSKRTSRGTSTPSSESNSWSWWRDGLGTAACCD